MHLIPLCRMLPKARVVYCSATGVSDVKNLAYMERLGLWGEGTAYKTFQNFLDTITQRGLGAAEMLAMEMKSAGVYLSRGLSFRQAEVGAGPSSPLLLFWPDLCGITFLAMCTMSAASSFVSNNYSYANDQYT